MPDVLNPPRFDSDLLNGLPQIHIKRRTLAAFKKCFYLIGLFIAAELPDDKIQVSLFVLRVTYGRLYQNITTRRIIDSFNQGDVYAPT